MVFALDYARMITVYTVYIYSFRPLAQTGQEIQLHFSAIKSAADRLVRCLLDVFGHIRCDMCVNRLVLAVRGTVSGTDASTNKLNLILKT